MIGFSSCYTLQHLEVPGYLQYVRETQLDPGEGKCSSSAVPPNVLSRHLLDSVLHSNPVGAFIPNRVTIIIIIIIWHRKDGTQIKEMH